MLLEHLWNIRHCSYAKAHKDNCDAAAVALAIKESRGSQAAAAGGAGSAPLLGADATSVAHLLPPVREQSPQDLPDMHAHM